MNDGNLHAGGDKKCPIMIYTANLRLENMESEAKTFTDGWMTLLRCLEYIIENSDTITTFGFQTIL